MKKSRNILAGAGGPFERKWMLLIVLMAVAAFYAPAIGAGEGTVGLQLFDLEGSSLKYKGQRKWVEADGIVTETTVYSTPNGKEIQRVQSKFHAASLALISYRLVDHRSGREEVITVSEGRVRYRFVEEKGEDPEEDDESWKSGMAASVVVTRLIRRHWDELMQGGEIEFDLLVASRLETVGFRVRRGGEAVLRGQPVIILRMEPSSWIIRALVDPMDFIMAKATGHALLEYRGRSTIATDDGEDQDLRLVFQH